MYLSRILPVPLGDEVVELSLDDLPSDIDEYITVLREERCPPSFWLKLASECGARRRSEDCETVLQAAIHTLTSTPPPNAPVHRSKQAIAEEVAPLHAMLSSLQLSKARGYPKVILRDAKYQNLAKTNPNIASKDQWQQAAAFHDNSIVIASSTTSADPRFESSSLTSSMRLSRGIFLTTSGKTDEALRSFESVLQKQPRNPVALLGKACCLLRKRSYVLALKLYQDVLRISIAQAAHAATQSATVGPDGELVESQASKWLGPDPRVGIGLCLQGLGRTTDAQRAWMQAVKVDSANAAPHLLLGLSKLNIAKQPQDLDLQLTAKFPGASESAARSAIYREGIAHIEVAWKLDNKNSMAAVALAEHFSARALASSSKDKTQARKDFERALKLAEHAIQYADNRAAVNQAWLIFARTAHLYSFLDEASTEAIELRTLAQRYYQKAADDIARTSIGGDGGSLAPGHVIATLGLAQLQISRGENLGAVNTLEDLMARPQSVSSSCLELTLVAASLRSQSHPGATPTEKIKDRTRARLLLDRTTKVFAACRAIVKSDDVHDNLEYIDEAFGENNLQANSESAFTRTAIAQENLGKEAIQGIVKLANDELIHVENADLFLQASGSAYDFTRAAQSYLQALRVFRTRKHDEIGLSDMEKGCREIRLQANLGASLALCGIQENIQNTFLSTALSQLQETLNAAGGSSSTNLLDAEKTIILFNIGRVLEASENFDAAQKAYESLLVAHPEYVDAKVRLALMAVTRPDAKGNRDATRLGNILFKEAISSDPMSLDVRGAYVCFLSGDLPGSPNPPQWEGVKETIAQLFMGPTSSQSIQIFGSSNAARAVNDEARHDAFTLAALAWSYYNLGHNIKTGSNAKKEKQRALLRCCDLLDKALTEDPRCAFALQGLAILAAEGSLVDLASPSGLPIAQDMENKRRKAADDAISMFTKIREVNDDLSVSVCMGHAFLAKEDYERAFKSYELAARKAPPKPSLLQYMARATYHLGMQVRSFVYLKESVSYLEDALAILQQRNNSSASTEAKFVRYNIAVTRQKMLQMLFDLPVEERQLEDLQEAIKGIETSQTTFRELLPDAQGSNLSYITAEIVEQRILYGDSSLLRQSVKHVEEQTAFETEARLEKEAVAARKRDREEASLREKERLDEERRLAAESIEADRKRAIEEARTWQYAVIEEEKPRKERKVRSGGGKKKRRKNDVGGSEIETSESERENGNVSDDNDMIVSDEVEVEQGHFSDEEVDNRMSESDDSDGNENRERVKTSMHKSKKKKLRRATDKGERKEKRTRKSETLLQADENLSNDESRPNKKPKKGRMRRAVDEDIIESEEEV